MPRRWRLFGIGNHRVEVWRCDRIGRPRSLRPHDRVRALGTALDASLTSRRVGRGSSRIDSKTWVERSRTPIARARRCVLRHPRDLLERHLESEVAARHHHPLRDAENTGEIVQRRRPFDLAITARPPRPRMSSAASTSPAVCKIDGARDPRRAQHEAKIPGILLGNRRGRKRHAGSIEALCCPSGPPLITTVTISRRAQPSPAGSHPARSSRSSRSRDWPIDERFLRPVNALDRAGRSPAAIRATGRV